MTARQRLAMDGAVIGGAIPLCARGLGILGAPAQGAAATHVETLAGPVVPAAGIASLEQPRKREKIYG